MPEPLNVDELAEGDILLYRAVDGINHLHSALIRKLDGTEVSHAGLYMGRGEIAEALAAGLDTRSVNKSFANTKWVAVCQLRNRPASMAPVLDVARTYLGQHNRYAYGQILLLAGICLTRKLDCGNWLLRRIARLVFDASALLLEAFRREGKEPMICSEFVFRTYEEATDEDNDPYALEILSQMTGTPRRRFLRLRRAKRVVAPAPSAEVPAIHPGSLLARMQAEGETPQTLSESASRMAAAVAPSEEYLDSLIERYLAESEGVKAATRGAADEGGAEDSIDAVLDAARRFTAGLCDAGTRKAEAILKLHGSDKGAGEAAPSLAKIVADFVTPGDLLKSPSLRKVKTIQL